MYKRFKIILFWAISIPAVALVAVIHFLSKYCLPTLLILQIIESWAYEKKVNSVEEKIRQAVLNKKLG